MHALRVVGFLFVATIGSALYWKLGYNVGLPLLLLVLSMAIVGQGNRLLWLAVVPLLSCAIAAVGYLLFSLLPEKTELLKLFAFFVAVTVFPAAILWSAAKFKATRSRSRAEGTCDA